MGPQALKLCRFVQGEKSQIGLYRDGQIINFHKLAKHRQAADLALPQWTDPLDLLSEGCFSSEARRWNDSYSSLSLGEQRELQIDPTSVRMLPPLLTPRKFLLLAGNYMEHIEEGGERAEGKQNTFPYFFMKPPSTTLVGAHQPLFLPKLSPHTIDWEIELGVVIARKCKRVSASEALKYVAGYTIVNDISNRKFSPNPARKTRNQDAFFDWLHGKWFDGFAPVGPCIISATDLPDPQRLALRLKINGQLYQNSSTSRMVFPVAEIIEFISSFVTLEPGDLISTGTAAGVGNAQNIYLHPGDVIKAQIENIGVLATPVRAE